MTAEMVFSKQGPSQKVFLEALSTVSTCSSARFCQNSDLSQLLIWCTSRQVLK